MRFLASPSPAAVAGGATAPTSNIPSNAYDPDQPLPAPKGLANPYELTFGTVCGVCAGVFIKKGLKAAAFILGGMFVILQVRQSYPRNHLTNGYYSTLTLYLGCVWTGVLRKTDSNRRSTRPQRTVNRGRPLSNPPLNGCSTL